VPERQKIRVSSYQVTPKCGSGVNNNALALKSVKQIFLPPKTNNSIKVKSILN
jgi:hypothetical protein